MITDRRQITRKQDTDTLCLPAACRVAAGRQRHTLNDGNALAQLLLLHLLRVCTMSVTSGGGRGVGRLRFHISFCSCDLDLDPMTLIIRTCWYILRRASIAKVNKAFKS